jgi:hypothetical protein
VSDPTWKRDEVVGTQAAPTWAMYAEAMNKFRRSASSFMEHVHLLTEARMAYQEALTVGNELRNRLDSGDQVLSSVMTQLEQVINDHLSEPVVDRKRPELVREEQVRGKNAATGTDRNFP